MEEQVFILERELNIDIVAVVEAEMVKLSRYRLRIPQPEVSGQVAAVGQEVQVSHCGG